MADRGDTHYHVPTLNTWFAISSVALLVSAVWMMLFDFTRDWKVYQRDFQSIEVERGRAELESPEALAVLEEEARLQATLDQALANRAARAGELADAKTELAQVKDTLAKTDAAARVAKQQSDWERYLIEEHRLHHGEDSEYQERMEGLQTFIDHMSATEKTKKTAQLAVDAQSAVVASFDVDVKSAELAHKNAAKSIELVRKKLAKIAPASFAGKLANFVRDDIPGLDFVGPLLQVKKVLPPNLTFELNFTKKPRIDMCITCHLPIERSGFEDEQQPFQTHPRLDMFLSAKSPHPMSEFGCTICHRGAGEALVFQRVDHRATDEEEGERWEEEHHWHKQHYWDYPMLSSEYVEASCVQCHKDSMELIEPEAPAVSEGYQLFERYGCYACHKVDWFPTKRRPGPTLAKITQKTDEQFIQAWVKNPKQFRPTTWMPQIFHLENFSADTEVVHSEFGAGRVMMGDEWSDTALHAVVKFILSRASGEKLPALPVEGDAMRGRESFRLVGCAACHNVSSFDKDEEELATDPIEKLRGSNEHGPNLRGIATKTSPEWVFAWLKDPKAYWAETRMPNLRLSDQDAADIVAYMFEDLDGYFMDTPEGWEEGLREYKRDVLEEQARWFFNREHPDALNEKFGAEWKDDQTLLKVVGEKWVLAQGCHSCHEIPGLEDAQPIGTELTTWASKTVDKLDFGFMPEIEAEERGMIAGGNAFAHFTTEKRAYRENFLEQKLKAPRSFDRRKIKNPSERLRMPWFDFNDEQIKSIAVFVAGLVEDEVQHAKMVPSKAKAQMDFGKRVIRQKNCAACHEIDPAKVSFDDEEGVRHHIQGKFLALDGEEYSPPTDDLQAYLADYIERMRAEDPEFELEELLVSLYEPAPSLESGTLEPAFITNFDTMDVTPAWGGDLVDVIVDYYQNPYDESSGERVSRTGDPEGKGRVQDVDGEWRDFTKEEYTKLRWSFAPPALTEEGNKLQRDWFYKFLLSPVPLRQQIRVHMPTFNWNPGEVAAVVDFFRSKDELNWPRKYARNLLMSLGQTPAEVAAGISAMGLSGSTTGQVEGIVNGLPVETKAGMPNLLAYGDAQGFQMTPPIDPQYEVIPERQPGSLDKFVAIHGDFATRVKELVTGEEGPKCSQCHFVNGNAPSNPDPITWAPDLKHARERLRADWLRAWLTDPSVIYPGTSMPGNFALELSQWQSIYPSSSKDQIDAVMAWLYNWDRGMLND